MVLTNEEMLPFVQDEQAIIVETKSGCERYIILNFLKIEYAGFRYDDEDIHSHVSYDGTVYYVIGKCFFDCYLRNINYGHKPTRMSAAEFIRRFVYEEYDKPIDKSEGNVEQFFL